MTDVLHPSDGFSARRRRAGVYLPACALALLAAGIVYGAWFHSGRLVLFWDQTFPLDPALDLRGLFSVWHSAEGYGGTDATSIAMIPYFATVWFLETAMRSAGLAQMTLYFAVLTSSLLGAYALCRAVIGGLHGNAVSPLQEIASCSTAALLYTFNPYAIFYEWRIVSTTIFLQALLPWWLLLLLSGARDDGERLNLRRLALLFLVTVGMSPGLSNPAMVPIAALLAVGCIWCGSSRPRKRYVAATALTSFLGMCFWLIPLLANTSAVITQGGYGGTVSALVQNSKNLSPGNLVRFLGMLPATETYNGEPDYPWAHIYAGGGWWNLFTVLPLVCWGVIAHAAFRRRSFRNATPPRILAVLALLFLILSGGSNGLLGRGFLFVFEHLKWFGAYRDPDSEFGYGVVLTVSLLLGCALCRSLPLALQMSRRKAQPPVVGAARRAVPRSALLAIVVTPLALGTFAWPMFTGAVFRGTGPVRASAYVRLPSVLTQIADVLRTEDGSGRAVLSFPEQATPLEAERWPSGFVGLDPLISLTGRPIISTLSSDTAAQDAVDQLYAEFVTDPAKAAAAARDMGIEWLLFRWDNNYRFGGIGSTQELRSIEHSLLAGDLVRLSVNSPSMTLVRLAAPSNSYVIGDHTLVASSLVQRVNLRLGDSALMPVQVGRGGAEPPIAHLLDARVDVGSQALTLRPRSSSLEMALMGPAEGSARIPITTSRVDRYLIVKASMSSSAGFDVAASRYVHGAFVAGSFPSLINPTTSEGGFAVHTGTYTYVYDLDSLSFVPNELDVHLDARGRAIAHLTIAAVEAVATVPTFTRAASVVLSGGSAAKSVYEFNVPALNTSGRTFHYLGLSVVTNSSAKLYAATGRVFDGRYEYGSQLQPISEPDHKSLVIAPNGSISSKSASYTYFSLEDQHGLNTLFLVVLHSGAGSANVTIRYPMLTSFAPTVTAYVERLDPNVEAVFPGISTPQPVRGVVLRQNGVSALTAASFTSKNVGFVYPEAFSPEFVLQDRVASGSWTDVHAVHVAADGFLNGWLVPAGAIANRADLSGASAGRTVYFRVVFTGDTPLNIGIMVTLLGAAILLIGTCVPTALARRRRRTSPPAAVEAAP